MRKKSSNRLSKESSKLLFNKDDFVFLGRWVTPVIESEIWLDWGKTKEARLLDVPGGDFDVVWFDGNYLLSKNSAYPFLIRMIDDERSRGSYDTARTLFADAENICDQSLRMAASLQGKEITLADFTEAFALEVRLRLPWMGMFAVSDVADRFVKEYSETHSIKPEEIQRWIPQLENSLTQDQKKIYDLKVRIQKAGLAFDFGAIEQRDRTLSDEILAYQAETVHIGTHHFWGEERTMERLMDAIAHAHVEKINTPEAPADFQVFADIIAAAGKWRLECAYASAKLAFALRPFLTELSKMLGVAYEDSLFLTLEEISQISTGRPVSDTRGVSLIPALSERKKAFGMYRLAGATHIIVGKELEEIERRLGLRRSYAEVTSIRGSIGNKGVVKGKVAIVLKPTDGAKVEKGTILVAPETTPDFIPAMGKAAAFITDIGGITSHAAIVAREMGKPCIIGTKIATKVLKDGDVVEVDAEKGIVRKIK